MERGIAQPLRATFYILFTFSAREDREIENGKWKMEKEG